MAACQFCAKDADEHLTYMASPVCRECAHNVSHAWPLQENQVPTPFVDDSDRVVPYGVYPNIDLS